MQKIFLLSALLVVVLGGTKAVAQCCAGGSGSPIAGGTSQGVLAERQMELNANVQYNESSKFLEGDAPAEKFLERFNSKYIYLRAAYGVTKDFTMSVESGYFFNKTEYRLHYDDTVSSSGIADLILFPRYDVFNQTDEDVRTEVTLGLGLKIPLGTYNDSLFDGTFGGKDYYQQKPPGVQPTSGSNDLIFYGFVFRGYPLENFRIFSSVLYIKKGWNPKGEKFGDYASVSLFAGKTLFGSLGATLQLKAEFIGKIQRAPGLPIPNYDPDATGGKKLYIVPQISYPVNDHLTVYALSETPLYQYVNKIQVASQEALTVGLSYRFYLTDPE